MSFSPLGFSGNFVLGVLKSANMNSTADQAIPIILPPGVSVWRLSNVGFYNPSISLTTAAGGVYTAASKGGTAVIAAVTTYAALTTNSHNVAGGILFPAVANSMGTAILDLTTFYLSLTTGQGVAATCDIWILGTVLPFG